MHPASTRIGPLELTRQPRAPLNGRPCRVPDCPRPARRRGRSCNACSLRAWRKAHRDADRAREAQRTFTEEQVLIRNARATVAMAIKRGRLRPQPCQTCHAPGLPHHPDPRKKDQVLWLCRTHRTLQAAQDLRTRQAQAEQDASATRQAAWDALRARFAAEWPALAPDIKADLTARAAASPLGRLAPPGSPLARQALIRAFGAWQAACP